MKVKITIITVCYNSGKTIQKTIESVLNQEYKDIEYIIVDGASSDNTLAIIKSFQPFFTDKGITYKWISEPDKGISDAFNKGIQLANGEIIGIINSDDWLEPNALALISNNLDDRHSIYCGSLKIYDEYSNFIKIRKSRPILLPLGMYIMHPTVFVKRDAYLKNKFDLELKITMDYDILLRFRNQRYKFKNINEVIANMRQGGLSCNVAAMRVEEKLTMKRNLSAFSYLIARLKLQIETKVIKLFAIIDQIEIK